jgi:hypothetical protein
VVIVVLGKISLLIAMSTKILQGLCNKLAVLCTWHLHVPICFVEF